MDTIMSWLAPILREKRGEKISRVIEFMMREQGIEEADKNLVVAAARFVLPSNFELRFKKMTGEGSSTRKMMKDAYLTLEGYYTTPRLVKRCSLEAEPLKKPPQDMKVLAFTAGPREGGNSDTLVEEALRGARDAGASTETIRLIELPETKMSLTLT